MSERPPKFRSREGYMRDRETGKLRPEGEMRESAKKMMEEELETDREEEELQNPGRRLFTKGVAAFGGAALLGVPERWLSDSQDKVERNAEGEPIYFTPDVQLAKYKKVEDIDFGLQSVASREYDRILRTPSGQKDMEDAAQNISELDMQRFVQPFIDRGFQHQLAYMIAIQETRGKTATSWAGAKGVTGIMPLTAEHYGYNPEDVNDPYIAAEISARYLAEERDDRFGENVDMLLHAYNGGGGLFGFTDAYPFKERTPENFYAYMEEKINTETAEKLRTKYHVHTFDQRTKNLNDVSTLYQVSLDELLEANPNLEPTEMAYGDEIHIPLESAGSATWRQIFRKYFETLYYTFEVHGKYAALKENGLVAQIEAPLDRRLASAG